MTRASEDDVVRAGRRLALGAVGAVAFTLVAAAGAAAAAPGPGATAAARAAAAGHGSSTAPQGPVAGFLLDRGRYVHATDSHIVTFAGARGFLLAGGVEGRFTRVDVPGALRTVAFGINDRGQVVGSYERPASPSPPPAPAG